MATAVVAIGKKAGTAKTRDPRVDALVADAPEFGRPILEYLRSAVHEAVPEVTEDIKWGRPFFLLDGAILCNMSAFSKHCSFGFWSANMTKLLEADGIDGSGGAGSVGRITKIDDLPSRGMLLKYLKTAAQMIRKGESGPGATGDRTSRSVKTPLPVPSAFAEALAKSEAATANFEGLPPSCRREYIEWILSAKREETRKRRVAEAVEKIAQGKRHNDTYR